MEAAKIDPAAQKSLNGEGLEVESVQIEGRSAALAQHSRFR
jgi:hypothetical protein